MADHRHNQRDESLSENKPLPRLLYKMATVLQTGDHGLCLYAVHLRPNNFIYQEDKSQ